MSPVSIFGNLHFAIRSEQHNAAITWPQALISEVESLADAAQVYGDVRL
jgi:hypothetical protein